MVIYRGNMIFTHLPVQYLMVGLKVKSGLLCMWFLFFFFPGLPYHIS